MVKNTVKTAVLLAALGGLMIGVGSSFGRGGALIRFLLALVFVGGSYWFSDRPAITAARAEPVSEKDMPEYYRVVRELTTAAGLPMPQLYVTPDRQPNDRSPGQVRQPVQHPSHRRGAGRPPPLDERSLGSFRPDWYERCATRVPETSQEPINPLRPRARLVLTIGSKLISTEKVAPIDLLKNAYDADAHHVMVRPSGPTVERDNRRAVAEGSE
jgi:Zn-dependent protease with chaperone function